MEGVLKREIILNRALAKGLAVGALALATALGAFIRVPLPFTPVPLTLQTFFVLLSGLLLGARLGAASQLLYLAAGLLGLPIFTGAGSGLTYIIGPTGGYILSFLIIPVLIGKSLRLTQDNLAALGGVLVAASLLILLAGALWLKVFFGFSGNAFFWAGIAPFIPGDLLKSAAALSLYAGLRPRLKEIF